jgi:hypothetical protein
MSRKVYRISIMLHALWMLTAGAALADDPSAPRVGDDRWVPSIALVLGFTTQKHEGSVASCRRGLFFCNIPFRPFDDGQQNINLLNVGGSILIETPTLPLPLNPKLFFGGEIEHVSSQRKALAKEADPKTELIEPDTLVFPDASILGQGSATYSDADNRQYGAVIGLSFPVDIGDWQLSIRPSARYLNQKFYFTGIVSDGDRPGVLAAPPPTTVVLLQGSDNLTVDAVGPALELELAAASVKGLAASVYVSGGAYRVLSDRDVFMRTQDTSTPATGVYRGTWTAEIDPWIYRASVGMRVRWVGGPSGWLFGVFGDRSK